MIPEIKSIDKFVFKFIVSLFFILSFTLTVIAIPTKETITFTFGIYIVCFLYSHFFKRERPVYERFLWFIFLPFNHYKQMK